MSTEDALRTIARLAHEIAFQALGNKESERARIGQASALIEKLANGRDLTPEEQSFIDDFLAQSL